MKRVVVWAVAIAAVVAAVVVGRSALDRLRDDTPVATDDDAGAQIVEAQVRDLVETFDAAGTLQYDEAIDVAATAAGTVLAVRAADEVVANGAVLAQIDDRAVVWLDGETPAWRALAEGDEGIDVLQLETALTALGFNADGDVAVDEEYTSATETMVEAWQASLGVDETGRVELGAVVFGADRDRIAAVDVAVGDRVSAGQTMLALGSSTRYATLDAAPAEAATLAVGDAVEVELPDRSTIAGQVSALVPGDETWAISVAFPVDTVFPATDVATVEMEWTHTVAADVVTIPSAALLRLDDGSYTVEVVGADGDSERVEVEVGVAVGTRVEITSGLTEGTSIATI